MKTKNGFVQGYNAQAAVTTDQIILAALVSQEPTDHHLLPPTVQQVRTNLQAAAITSTPPENNQNTTTTTTTTTATTTTADDPTSESTPTETAAQIAARLDTELLAASQNTEDLAVIAADAGYANEDTYTSAHTDGLILLAPLAKDETRVRGGDPSDGADLSERPGADLAQQRLRTDTGKALYKHRGQTVEPTFGQLKDRGGMRQFTRRGIDAVQAEFSFACTIHNLRKLLNNWTSPLPTT